MTDHVLSMDLQDIAVHVCLSTQVLVVKVRNKLDIVIPIKVQEIHTVSEIRITIQCLTHIAFTVLDGYL